MLPRYLVTIYKAGESGLGASFYSDGNVLELGSSDIAQHWEHTKCHQIECLKKGENGEF